MRNGEFIVGTLIKGKDLRGYILCKILSEDMKMQGFQYEMGMNEDVKPLSLEGNCKAGLHFCFVKDVCDYLEYGTKLAIITVPDEEDVYVDYNKFRTHRLEIREIMAFEKIDTWKYLCENGADITALDNRAIWWAAENGYLEVVKCLYENGADITAGYNVAVRHAAVRHAAARGHLEVVKYLYENGADIGHNVIVHST